MSLHEVTEKELLKISGIDCLKEDIANNPLLVYSLWNLDSDFAPLNLYIVHSLKLSEFFPMIPENYDIQSVKIVMAKLLNPSKRFYCRLITLSGV